FDEPAQAASFFDWVEVGALKVFDQAEHELLVIAGVAAYDRGYRVETGEPRRAPPALAGDELVTVGQPPHEKRLQHAVKPDRLRALVRAAGRGPPAASRRRREREHHRPPRGRPTRGWPLRQIASAARRRSPPPDGGPRRPPRAPTADDGALRARSTPPGWV